MIITLSLAAAIACAQPQVHDGDTIRCGAERIRIANIDAPELPGSPKCRGYQRERSWCDYRAASRARSELEKFLAGGRLRIDRLGYDKYGRTLARVSVNGRDAGEYLVRLGLARIWR